MLRHRAPYLANAKAYELTAYRWRPQANTNIVYIHRSIQLQCCVEYYDFNVQGGPKKPPQYSHVHSPAVFFTFTNNIPCGLKLRPTYIEAQTKLVFQQVVQKNYNRVKAPRHRYVTMAKHNSNACLYLSNNSIQQQTVSKQLFNVLSVNLNYCF